MGIIGSILVGFAVTLIVGAYLARPFRVVSVGEGADLDRDIEVWVSQIQVEDLVIDAAETDLLEEADPEPVNFCSKCGRRLDSDDRFCPGCGTQLKRGTAQ